MSLALSFMYFDTDQVTPLDGRFDERRHETESSSMAEKRVTLTKYHLFISLLF